MREEIIIGSRGSDLALWQANYIKDRLDDLGHQASIKVIKTKGDAIQNLSFDKMEGKGFFTKEIEDALLNEDIDLAVHSLKDLQTTHPQGLTIAAVSERANPADWIVINKEAYDPKQILKIKENAVVGTSSGRRKSQLLHFRPDIKIKDIRGNVPTRLSKLASPDFDAIILAAAGITRLDIDLKPYKVLKLNPKEFVSAPAQGVLAFQTRISDKILRKILLKIHQKDVAARTNIERGVLKLLGGGCQTPLGVYCEQDDNNNYHVWAALAKTWKEPVVFARVSSATSKGLSEAVIDKLKSE
jgi:hydroxymethylbilane synthase